MSWISLMYTQKEDIKAKILEYEVWRINQNGKFVFKST